MTQGSRDWGSGPKLSLVREALVSRLPSSACTAGALPPILPTRFSSCCTTRRLMENGKVGLSSAQQRPHPCRCMGVGPGHSHIPGPAKPLTGLVKQCKGRLQLSIHSEHPLRPHLLLLPGGAGEGDGCSRPSGNPRALAWVDLVSSGCPVQQSPRPGVMKVAPRQRIPLFLAPVLDGRTDAGSSHREASEGLERGQTWAQRLQPRVSLHMLEVGWAVVGQRPPGHGSKSRVALPGVAPLSHAHPCPGGRRCVPVEGAELRCLRG